MKSLNLQPYKIAVTGQAVTKKVSGNVLPLTFDESHSISVIRLGYEPNVISSSISALSEILALHPSRFSP
mgnify:CR=1 FL=1